MCNNNNKNASLDPHLAVTASECLLAYPLKSLLQSLMSPLYSRTERDGPTGGPGRWAGRPVPMHYRSTAGAGAAAGPGHADARMVGDRHCH